MSWTGIIHECYHSVAYRYVLLYCTTTAVLIPSTILALLLQLPPFGNQLRSTIVSHSGHSSPPPRYDACLQLLFERSEFLIATSKKKKKVRVCVCSTNLGFSGERIMYFVPDTYVPHFMIPGTYYVPDTYVRTWWYA